ncbi:helix-turn-helix domain-containing protein [Plantactinospora sp. WMMB334]|uniref:helix-turn-helix domain-containing protein n=1 Tax=Plantactinospora sp. WMMB334 TaxID=3404119 RepID=UPI003B9468E8
MDGEWPIRRDASEAVQLVFGLVLRQLRTEAGMSLRTLGRVAHYDYSRLSRAERGEHLVDPAVVAELDKVLDTGGLLARLRTLAPPAPARRRGHARAPMTTFVGTDGGSVEFRTPDGRTVHVNLSRRELAQLLASGALRAVLPAGTADLDEADRVRGALAEPRVVDTQVLAYFRRLLDEHFAADRMLGPRQLLGPVLAQLDVLDAVRRHARPGVAGPTMRLLAQYAEFAGWLYQDSGDLQAAMHWSDRASQWALAAGDDQMTAYMLIRKSNIATLDNDPVAVVDLAAAAQKVRGSVSPKLIALAGQQEARGWAQLGDVDRFRRNLATAADLLHDRPHDVDPEAPVYLHHYDMSTLEEQSASCYRSAGDTDTAIAILERKLTDMPQHLARDQAHHMAKLANVVIEAAEPDPERAADLGLRCVATARESGSARIGKELRALDRELGSRWPNLPASRALHDALAS